MLRHRFNWKRLSMAAALAYAHDRSDARIIFQTRPGAYNDESLIEFLGALHDELGGAKVTLIWDGLPSHRSRKMQAFIRSQRRWVAMNACILRLRCDGSPSQIKVTLAPPSSSCSAPRNSMRLSWL